MTRERQDGPSGAEPPEHEPASDRAAGGTPRTPREDAEVEEGLAAGDLSELRLLGDTFREELAALEELERLEGGRPLERRDAGEISVGAPGRPEASDPVRRGAAVIGRRLSSQADMKRQRGAYNGAIEAIFAILIATGAGYWADEHYGTTPRWLIVGAVIGFAAFVLRIWRMRELLEESPEEPSGDEDVESRDESDEGSRGSSR